MSGLTSSPRAGGAERRISRGAGGGSRKTSYLSMSKEIHTEGGVNAKAGGDPVEEAVVERILKASDPNLMSTPVYFDYKKEARVYKFFPSVGAATNHFELNGGAIRKDSPEAIQQEEDRQRRQREVALAAEAELNPALVDEGVSTKILKNQFNYSDRGSQTMNNMMKERAVVTDPPPAVSFGAMATAWEIYDAYEADRLQTEKAAAAQKKAAAAHRAGKEEEATLIASANSASIRDEASAGGSRSAEAILNSGSFRSAVKIMERMINQNDCFDIIDDFRFWEDQSDLYKEDGTLLPLWQFYTKKTKNHAVTSITINKNYNDLFAVGYGSYDFQKQVKGTVNCFTFKNAVPAVGGVSLPASPELSFHTDSGVLCLAFHPTQPWYLACGLYDGSVCVFDLRNRDPKTQQKPLYTATVRTGKHSDPVWQVYWKTDSAVDLAFNSVSTDGRITSWVMHKKQLLSKDVLTLTTGAVSSDPEAMLLSQLGGMCMDHSTVHGTAVIGTQEGAVLLCSTSYNGQCLERYDGHSMAVHAARWNPFHPDIFITCSADWTVKLWLKTSTQPLMTFDLGDSVGDVVWAPYSSTVFAAVTSNGKTVVFDLNQNKTEPLCVQTVVKNAKLTHLDFSPIDPIVLVGDSRGSVLSLKLSPNLRKTVKPAKGEPDDAAALRKLEVDKLTHLVDVTMKDRALLASD